MKISENWLRTWVNPAIDSETLSDQLTMLGLEVDELAPVAKPFTGVVVGEVLTVEQHPDADRLRVTTVNIGSGEPLQIVCGAPNVRAGMKAPVATIGAVLPGDFKIKKGKLRGVESQGMLCGASEIDLEDKIDGLLELPTDAPVGVNIREYLKLDDNVIDISITPNRGDCFSIRGIAREIAVINQLQMNEADIKSVDATIADEKKVVISTEGAPRYLGRVIKNVNVKAATPEWMEQALARSGIRTHSILVDVTNYVLMELGQPMHAFDLAKIEGTVHVRQAQPQEKLQLLNDQEVELQEDIMVIADDQKALAIAGIMGGLASSVTDDTTDIFLESAFFAPLAIAGRARRFGLHTDSSQRYERGVDFELPLIAMNRASQLIQELAGGEFGPITVAEKTEILPKREAIELKQAQVDQLLGYQLTADFIADALNRLGCEVTVKAEGEWSVVPPSHRYDMAIYQDLIEEVARIDGYDNIQISLPSMDVQLAKYQDRFEIAELRQTIVTLGYQEAISFSFADAKLEKQLNPQVNPLMLANPISSDLAAMRSTLLSSLIPCVQYNLNRQQSRVRFFELGLRFDYQDAKSIEDLKQIPTLALVAVGSQQPESWHVKPQPMDFFDFKGEIEEILAAGRVKVEYVRSELAWLHPGQSAEILVDGQSIGYLGRLHPSLENELDLTTTWVAELDQTAVLQSYVSNFTELSRFPSIRRDIALLISDNINVRDIQQLIEKTGGELLDSTWLFDVYTGQGVEEGKRSLAFALLWQHPSRTLEDAEIKSGMDNIIQVLENTYQATLRAS
ncbi:MULTISPECIES: phenylalanine--tRNA ligase subunit beta [Acinetobacter calcoaceticus/baumannii complex]|uniref:phenylalanine--tRNA ligase subunit beta n=1 Tax=Acinetobacter calcoaceticus/baumannii complex TaxID=909768 RepID=UPI0002CFF0CA|nr:MULTISPECIES: phenylalanine--tRNA ligase subunit beta [Acinetobacter calcoaceticus/baumannii complex]AVN19495.1 phenylalanine--tRNA ligase subunit beta [Acinetobacter pittii]ENW14819.1 phenylalanyl-tRNA synthetase beta chain [Acinetobacter pittii ATCC 19004 = CIP 70.29]EXH35764.1 phenylalanine--tRNA ligase, beta subunit [Acinetobacter sp. 1245249]EYT25298.1 phenylalanine--tRNA ligase, beta subunit [Acinetobacter sp. 1564232]KQF79580.1 phenylalanine--tRNA ligase subunit beta [Acinetobacter p